MLLPMIIFLMVLSPLFIPVAVTVVHGLGNWRSRRIGQSARFAISAPASA